MSCKATNLNSKFCGVLTSSLKIYDSVLGKYRLSNNDRDGLYYYRDSLGIEEQIILQSRSTNGVLDTSYSEIYYYKFSDLKSNTEIHFKTFTDTATPIKMFKIIPDTIIKSAWMYYGYDKPIDPETSASILADTIIDGIKYKRILTYSTHKIGNKIDTSFTLHYANCNSKLPMFQYNIRLSKKYANGCPIQMLDQYWYSTSMKLRFKLDFFRGSLTTQEHKVFDAWEKYAKKHPIK